jgi:hypothetical protein
MKPWDKKEEWLCRGTNFLIMVKHHLKSYVKEDDPTGQHLWNVYAYIYPKHPHFDTFIDTDDLYQEACTKLPLHCGASFLSGHYDKNGVCTSIQVGSDYNHLYDKCYTHEEYAPTVFLDATELYDYLEEFTRRGDQNQEQHKE